MDKTIYKIKLEEIKTSTQSQLGKVQDIQLSFTHYLYLIIDMIQKRTYKSLDKDELGRYAVSLMTGIEYTPQKEMVVRYSRAEQFIIEVFAIISEINRSYRHLQITTILLQEVEENELIPKFDLVQYHFENFISEQFIYTERIKKLFLVIEKKAEKLHLNEEYMKLVGNRQKFFEVFESLINVRHKHTHEHRIDDNIYKQMVMVNMADKEAKNFDKEITKQVFKKTKKERVTQLIKNIKLLEVTTDFLTDEIQNIFYGQIIPQLDKSNI